MATRNDLTDRAWIRAFGVAVILIIGVAVCMIYRGQISGYREVEWKNLVVPVFCDNPGIIIGCTFLGMGLSIVLSLLLISSPAISSMTAVALNSYLYLCLIGLGIYFQVYSLTIIVSMVFLIPLSILAVSYRNDLWKGVKLMLIVQPVTQKYPKIHLVTILSATTLSIIEVGYFYGILQAYAFKGRNGTYLGFECLLHLYYFLGVFAGFFLYYCQSHAIAQILYSSTNSAQEPNSVKSDLNSLLSSIKFRIGSLFRAVMTNLWIGAFKKVLTSPHKQKQSRISRLTCYLFCITQQERKSIYFQEHNAVIGMALFGEDFNVASKKIESYIDTTDNEYLIHTFTTIEFYFDMVEAHSVSLCTLTGSMIGGGIGFYKFVEQELMDPRDAFLKALVMAALILVFSAFVNNLILAAPFQTLSSVMAIYSLRVAESKGKIKGNFEEVITPKIQYIFEEEVCAQSQSLIVVPQTNIINKEMEMREPIKSDPDMHLGQNPQLSSEGNSQRRIEQK